MQLIPEIDDGNNLLGNTLYIEELGYRDRAEDFDDGMIYRRLDYEHWLNNGIASSAMKYLINGMDDLVIDYAFRRLVSQDRDEMHKELSEYTFFLQIIQLIRKKEAVWLGLMRLFPDLDDETDIRQLYFLYKEVIDHYFHNEYAEGSWGGYHCDGDELFSVLSVNGLIETTSVINPRYDIDYDFFCDGYYVRRMYATRENLRYSRIGEYGYIKDIGSVNLKIEKAVIKSPCFTSNDSINDPDGKNDLKIRFMQAEINGKQYSEFLLVLCNAVIVTGSQYQPETEPVNRSCFMSIREFISDGCQNAEVLTDPENRSLTITGSGAEDREYSSLYASFICRYENIKLFSDDIKLKRYLEH